MHRAVNRLLTFFEHAVSGAAAIRRKAGASAFGY
jgi:hypothetical protein